MSDAPTAASRGLSAIGPLDAPSHRKVVGLTGNPGAGKSAAARIMAEAGALLFSADDVGHALLRSTSPTFKAIVDAFGTEILGDDGEIDRGTLGSIVFGSDQQLKRLNELVHPEIHRAIHERIEAFRASDERGPLVVEAALLYEWGAENMFDGVVVIAAPLQTRRDRFIAARGEQGKNFDRREVAQLPESIKIQRADAVIHNAEGLDRLRNQITDFMNH